MELPESYPLAFHARHRLFLTGGIALNYVPLLLYAIGIVRRKSAQQKVAYELAHKDAYARKYTLQTTMLLLVPLVLPLLAPGALSSILIDPGASEHRMRDTVTADGKGFDQDSGRAGNANVPIGRTTANEEPHLGSHSAPPRLLQGLSEEEVRLRLARGQGNNIKLPTSRTYWQILRENILTLIHLILFALSAVLLLLGRPLDAITTVAAISFNLVAGIFQEIRAKRALDRIALLTRPSATVLRAGHEQTVDPGTLVVGDPLVVRPGDQIVVEGRLVGQGWIDANEALLTGEFDLVRKRPGDPVSSGSFCVNGSAVYEALQVGTRSTAYQLTAGARIFRRVLTPLQRQATTVIRILLVLACYLGLALLMITTIRQTPLLQTVQMAVVIAGLVPNGLLLPLEEVKRRMKMDPRYWVRERWGIIYNALIAPRKARSDRQRYRRVYYDGAPRHFHLQPLGAGCD
jgi:hypothetical protein